MGYLNQIMGEDIHDTKGRSIIAAIDGEAASGGGGVEVIAYDVWLAKTKAQKRSYGLVALQDSSSGYLRGKLVYGANYADGILQSGTAASSLMATYSGEPGNYRLIVIALNSEASTAELTISASHNGDALTGVTLGYNAYYPSGTNRRNYRINAYDISVASGDTINVSVSDRTGYTSFVYAIVGADISSLDKALSTADVLCSGSNTSSGFVLYGTFSSSNGGTINMAEYVADTNVITENPGSGYKSAYIFWFSETT